MMRTITPMIIPAIAPPERPPLPPPPLAKKEKHHILCKKINNCLCHFLFLLTVFEGFYNV